MKETSLSNRVYEPQPQETTIDWEAILLTVWRQRWKIGIGLLVGVLGAGTLAFIGSAYESKSKILVRYVRETSAIDSVDRNVVDGDQNSPRSDAAGGSIVMNNEIEILTSADLAEKVAVAVGLEKLLDEPNQPGAIKMAGEIIQEGLTVWPSATSSVLNVTFQYTDPAVTTEVFEELVKLYFEEHLEIHRPGVSDIVQEQAKEGEKRLTAIDAEISKIMSEAGIFSTQGSLDIVEQQRTQLRVDLIALEAELAGAKARASTMEPVFSTNEIVRENGTLVAKANENVTGPSEEEFRRYQTLVDMVAQLQRRNLDLISKFTPESSLVAANSRQLEKVEHERRQLAARFPILVSQTRPTRMVDIQDTSRTDIDTELAKVSELEARKEIMENALAHYEEYASALPAAISRVNDLKRLRTMEEGNVDYFQSSLRRAFVDSALDPSRMPNLTLLQSPSLPRRVISANIKTVMFGVLGGGLVLGIFAGAFSEYVLDRRVKGPEQLVKELRLPLALTIPRIRGGERDRLLKLRPYARDVQDFLAYQWQLTQTGPGPKLVGVLGVGAGAGASTLIKSLAESWQSDGEKVLILDTKTVAEILRWEEGDSVSHDLQWDDLSTKDVELLFSRLRRAELSYVLFDLPLIGPGIPTRLIATGLDQILLVAAPNTTDRTALKMTYWELVEAGGEVTCIYNKEGSLRPKPYRPYRTGPVALPYSTVKTLHQ